jgi:glycosyltransferase involved in cell wall biosynthesis
MEFWFALYLRTARLTGFAIVWTAHDLLPHEPVFADDARARDTLLSESKLVIALSETTAKTLRELGAEHVVVIPHGPFASPYAVTQTVEEARASFGFDVEDVVVTLIGKIEAYKGADLLLLAAARLPASSRIRVLVVGSCSDASYRSELNRLANEVGSRVITAFERVPEGDVARYLQATDFAVFPFREITNSGSVILAQSFGLPIVIADLPLLGDIPNASAIRFQHSVESLVEALLQAENLSEMKYQEMSDAGLAWSMRSSWEDIALATVEAYRGI